MITLLLCPMEFAVNALGSLYVRLMCLFRGVVDAKMDQPAVLFGSDPGSVFSCPSVKTNALKTAFGILDGAAITLILGRGGLPQILPTVVHAVHVNMVDLKLGPLPGLYEPDYSMSQIEIAFDAQTDVATLGSGTCDISKLPGISFADFLPYQVARFFIIEKQRSDVICRQVIARILVAWFVAVSHLTLLRSLWSGFSEGADNAFPNPNYACFCAAGQP